MPGYDQQGPLGKGPMTGRRMGKCANFGANLKNESFNSTEKPEVDLPENIQRRGLGLGRGRGSRGRGMGFRNRFCCGF